MNQKWSEKAFFELGLLSNNDWAAKWISLPDQQAVEVLEIERKVYPVQYLRKTIELKDKIEKHVCMLLPKDCFMHS
jgi:alpha-L-rhamnosidase